MNYSQLKQKIYDDNKVELILEQLGCGDIHTEQGGKLIVASLPDGDNKRSIQIKLTPTLITNIRSKGISGSILDLIEYIHDIGLIEAKKWAMGICGYSEDTVEIEENPLDWLKKLKRIKKARSQTPILPVFDEEILNQSRFKWGASKMFFEDGISIETQKEFQIGFDKQTKRVIFPIRNLKGELVGLKGRTTTNHENKYMYIYPYTAYQRAILFNYHRAIEYAKGAGEVIIFEAEKSPMQMHSMDIYNCMGVGHNCVDITPYQLKILKDMHVDIIVAPDNGVDFEKLKYNYKEIGYFRNIYAIIDKDNLLKDKDSPSDNGIEIWSELYRNRIKLY